MEALLFGGRDYRCFVVMGEKRDQVAFIKAAHAEGITDEPDGEPELVCCDLRLRPDGEMEAMSLESEDDVEEIADFIRNAKARDYHKVGGIVVLYPGDPNEDLGYVDQLLRIPHLMNGQTRHIEVPVFIVNETSDGSSDFRKGSSSTPSGIKKTIEVTFGHEMKPEVIEWLVPEFVPLHQATAFSGEMDTRKSTLALDIAAAGSVWRPWFMGTENCCTPFITLVAADEDTYTTTVLPRFLAAGGNPDCLGCVKLEVNCVQQCPDGVKEYSTPLSFDEHLNLLGETIVDINNRREWKVGLLINDPIISFFGNKNYNSSQDSRDIMRGLKKLCEELKITIINICHFNKTQGLTAKQKTAGAKALVEAHRLTGKHGPLT